MKRFREEPRHLGNLARFIQPAYGVVIMGRPTPVQLREHREEIERNMNGVHMGLNILINQTIREDVLRRLSELVRGQLKTHDYLQTKILPFDETYRFP